MMNWLEIIHAALALLATGLYVIAAQNCIKALQYLPDYGYDYRGKDALKMMLTFVRFAWSKDEDFDRPKDGKGWGLLYFTLYLMFICSVTFALLNVWHAFMAWHIEEVSLAKLFAWKVGHIIAAITFIAAPASACFAAKNTPNLLGIRSEP